MKRPVSKDTAVYRTRRLYVRPLRISDIDGNYHRWFDDQVVCRYNSHGAFPKSKRELEEYVRDAAAKKDRIVWAIMDSSNGCHIGNISLQGIDWIARSAEFAILIGQRDYWGKGYAFEAACLLLEHGFDKLNLQRIHCGTAAANSAMQKLALKLGMKKEGVRRRALFLAGAYVDLWEYGLLKAEYKSHAGKA